MKAEYVVHWPGKDTLACEEHAKKLNALAAHMGFVLSATSCLTDAECANCENEAKKASAANEAGKGEIEA